LARSIIGEPALCDLLECGQRVRPVVTSSVIDVSRKQEAARVIHRGVEEKDGLILLTGAPGSGKSSVSAHFALHYALSKHVSTSPRRILFTGPNNVTVDAVCTTLRSAMRSLGYDEEQVTLIREITRKEKNQVPIDELDVRYQVLQRHLRLFQGCRGMSLLRGFRADEIVDLQGGKVSSDTGQRWAKMVPLLNKEDVAMVVSSTIVCCTMEMLTSRAILYEAGDFDYIISDNAKQATVAQLSAFASIPGVGSGLLVGDEKQRGLHVGHSRKSADVAGPFSRIVGRARTEGIGHIVNLCDEIRKRAKLEHIEQNI
jgi:NACalpha-BTF3-like transcription factor